MKRKLHIPDFSRKPKLDRDAKGEHQKEAKPAPPRPQVKPHSTSAKSGRRGS